MPSIASPAKSLFEEHGFDGVATREAYDSDLASKQESRRDASLAIHFRSLSDVC